MKIFKLKSYIGLALLLFLCLFSFTSCNKDKPTFSQAQTKEMLKQIEGNYHGSVDVAYYQGKSISKIKDGIGVSSDVLTFKMSLLPMAESIIDESIAMTLRNINSIEVKAEYKFTQRDNGLIHFKLLPQDVTILGGYGAPPTIKIIFCQNFGGDAETAMPNKNMMFNISPKELWINGERYKDFKQLVYHFEGSIHN
ncbi:DUF4840 domain-containing protein [Porphyromonadaceae bacterium W3.11]|nr:DUF4840 domain-containing protein [Porphyromonadaceae bacterium W3.11]